MAEVKGENYSERSMAIYKATFNGHNNPNEKLPVQDVNGLSSID